MRVSFHADGKYKFTINVFMTSACGDPKYSGPVDSISPNCMYLMDDFVETSKPFLIHKPLSRFPGRDLIKSLIESQYYLVEG